MDSCLNRAKIGFFFLGGSSHWDSSINVELFCSSHSEKNEILNNNL